MRKVDLPEASKGPWKIERFLVTHNPLRLQLQGRGVPPGTYTRLLHDEEGVYMSDTPAEMQDHQGFVSMATGDVLIGGLGLGLVIQALAEKDSVRHVHVIEKDQDVIDLVWPTYQERYGSKVSIELADAYKRKPRPGEVYDHAWWDIWPSICATNHIQAGRIKRMWANACGSQHVWCGRQAKMMHSENLALARRINRDRKLFDRLRNMVINPLPQ